MEKNVVVCFISSPKIPSPMDIIQHENSTISDSVSCGPAGPYADFPFDICKFFAWYSVFIYNLQIVRTFWQTRAFKKKHISTYLWYFVNS